MRPAIRWPDRRQRVESASSLSSSAAIERPMLRAVGFNLLDDR
jgi:hypothetical protein